MGRSISHGTPGQQPIHRSALQLHNLARHVADVASGRDWRTVRGLFRMADRCDGPFEVPASEAGRIGRVLRAASTARRMPADWGQFAALLADAAERAAAAGEPWEWR